jgi:hypothetical protein
MKITAGLNWILAPTTNFSLTVAFFRDVMGLTVMEEGIPVTDTQFSRYAQFQMPDGDVLEIVEPIAALQDLYTAPIPSLTVDDLNQALREFQENQVVLIAPLFTTKDGWGWTYFRALDGNIYQIQGPYTV